MTARKQKGSTYTG